MTSGAPDRDATTEQEDPFDLRLQAARARRLAHTQASPADRALLLLYADELEAKADAAAASARWGHDHDTLT